MTDFAAQQPGLDPLAMPPPGAIVEDIRQARRRAGVRFALAFALTWILLVGGMALAIASTGRVHPDFIAWLKPTIEAMHADGTLKAMSQKWFKTDFTTSTQ